MTCANYQVTERMTGLVDSLMGMVSPLLIVDQSIIKNSNVWLPMDKELQAHQGSP